MVLQGSKGKRTNEIPLLSLVVEDLKMLAIRLIFHQYHYDLINYISTSPFIDSLWLN
ncbi:unnamed protein product, partial [Strongylus vulgaris]